MHTRSGPDLNLGRPPSLLGATVYLLTGILGMATLWAHFTRIDVTVRAPGVVRPRGDVVRIVTEARGVIAAVRVKEGDQVRTGDILVLLDNREERRQTQTIQEQTLLLEEQLGAAEQRMADVRNLFELEKQQLELEIQAERKGIKRRRQEHQTQLQSAELRLSDARERHETNQRLLDEGLVSRQSQKEAESALRLAETQQREIEAGAPQESTLEALIQTRILRQAQFETHQRELQTQKVPTEQQLADLRLQLDRSKTNRQRLIIRSPATGTLVSFASLHPGEHLAVGTTLATLAPTPTVKVIESWLPNRDAKNVYPDQPVKLLADDSESFGGTVLSISPDARMTDPGSGTYRVLIAPDTVQPLRLGLGLEVRFITRTESILSLLFSKFKERPRSKVRGPKSEVK